MPVSNVVKQVNEFWKHADTARMQHQSAWTRNWNLYRQIYDWSLKAPWQSQIPFPKIPMIVNFSVRMIRKALRAAGRFFVFEAHGEEAKEAAYAAEMLVRDFWNSPQVNINRKVTINAMEAQICGQAIWKLYWRNGLRIDCIDPYDFWVDPSNRGRYYIHRYVRDWDELVERAKGGWYDKEAVQRLKGGTGSDEESAWRSRSGLAEPSVAGGRRECEVLEFWGDLIDHDGNLIMQNCWCVVGDRRELLRDPEPNPFLHGKLPFVRAVPLPIPFSPYGGSTVEEVAGMAELYTQLGNLAADGAMIDGVPVWEVDINNALHPHKFQGRGIYPGAMFEKASSQGQLITPVDKGYPASQMTLPVWRQLGIEIENNTSVTQFITGATGQGPERTATEIGVKSRQSGEFIGGLAEAMQDEGIGPMAEMSAALCAQFMSRGMFLAPRVQEALGENLARRLAVMDPARRYFYLTEQYSVRGRGVAGVFMRQEDLARLMQFLQLTQQIPDIWARINTDMLLRKVIEALHWEADDVLLSPEEVEQRQLAMAVNQAGAGGAPAQGQPLRGATGGGVPWQSDVERPLPQRPSRPGLT